MARQPLPVNTIDVVSTLPKASFPAHSPPSPSCHAIFPHVYSLALIFHAPFFPTHILHVPSVHSSANFFPVPSSWPPSAHPFPTPPFPVHSFTLSPARVPLTLLSTPLHHVQVGHSVVFGGDNEAFYVLHNVIF